MEKVLRMLRRIRIDSVTYNELVTKYHKYIEECDDLNPYYLKGYKDKNMIKATEKEMIIQGYRLNERYANDIILPIIFCSILFFLKIKLISLNKNEI